MHCSLGKNKHNFYNNICMHCSLGKNMHNFYNNNHKINIQIVVLTLIQEYYLTVHYVFDIEYPGADLGFIKGGGGLTQGTNLLGRSVQSTLPSMRSMLELGGPGGMFPQENFEK